jgi:hypothetical protein
MKDFAVSHDFSPCSERPLDAMFGEQHRAKMKAAICRMSKAFLPLKYKGRQPKDAPFPQVARLYMALIFI